MVRRVEKEEELSKGPREAQGGAGRAQPAETGRAAGKERQQVCARVPRRTARGGSPAGTLGGGGHPERAFTTMLRERQ